MTQAVTRSLNIDVHQVIKSDVLILATGSYQPNSSNGHQYPGRIFRLQSFNSLKYFLLADQSFVGRI